MGGCAGGASGNRPYPPLTCPRKKSGHPGDLRTPRWIPAFAGTCERKIGQPAQQLPSRPTHPPRALARRNLDQFVQLVLGQFVGGEFQRDGVLHDRVETDDRSGLIDSFGKKSSRVRLALASVILSQSRIDLQRLASVYMKSMVSR